MTTTKATILLVDDDPTILTTIGDTLQFEGYKVITAASAEQASTQLARSRPDLIILDISMPGMGGMGFLKTLSGAAGTIQYPVLVFTARAALNDFFAGLGVEGFLSKTEPPGRLLEEIKRIIGRRSPDPAPVPLVNNHGTGSFSVLLVEDDQHVRDHLLHCFQQNNHTVRFVDRGNAIFESILNHRPDVILMKYFLPDMNGSAVAERLANQENTRTIPVILYDESGIHSAGTVFPHVHAFTSSVNGNVLLKTVLKAVQSPAAHVGANKP
jgi:CheY-like chemotaxis protein